MAAQVLGHCRPPTPGEGHGLLAYGTLLSLPGPVERDTQAPRAPTKRSSPDKAGWDRGHPGRGGSVLRELPGEGQAGEK